MNKDRQTYFDYIHNYDIEAMDDMFHHLENFMQNQEESRIRETWFVLDKN